MDPRHPPDRDPAHLPRQFVAGGAERLVSVRLDDSWSTLEQEVALIDRLFGGDIAALFERHGDDGRRDIRG